MKLLVIYNPSSGGGNQLHQLEAAFTNYTADVEFCQLHRGISADIKAAARQGCRVIVAAGGDGTVNAVAKQLAGTSLTLGVIPVGTLNHFAKDLALPLTIEKAVKVILTGKIEKVDIGVVNGQIFINNSSVGIYPAVVRERQRHQHLLGKWPSALLALVKVMVKARRYHVSLRVEGKESRFRTPFVFIGNNSYRLRKVGFTNRNSLTSGKLSVYWVTAKNPLRITHIFLRALLGKAHQDKDFESLLARDVTISFRRRHVMVAFDGEIKAMRTPLHYKSNPRSLRVLVS